MIVQAFVKKLGRCPAAWLLLALLAPMWRAPVAAQDYIVDTNTGTVTITRYSGPGGAVSVPSAIDGLPVTSIGDAAFGFNYALTSVTIPDSVTNIGQIAFISCTSLTNVEIAAGVLSIGELAFKNCVSLAAFTVDTSNAAFSALGGVLFDRNQTALVQYPQGKTGDYYAVPAGIQTVASGAFYGCTGLTNLSLPASLKNIGDTAFYGCANLAAAPLPDGVTNVGLEAFQNCESLTQVEIPDSVTSLGQQAFYGCGSITNVTIGNGVPGIGDSTFTDCTNLLSVTLGDQVATIGYAAFAYCVSLTNVTLGSDVTNIGESAFSYCFDLPSIVIPEGVTTIGSQAFLYCSSLASINLPASMTNFGDRVFEFCGNLGAITVDPDNVAYFSVDGVLFDQQQARLVQYPINNPRSHYTIPNGTLSVADTAFVSAYYLTSVTIPASVASLETLAFYNCPEVVGFFFQGNAPALGDNVFDLDDAATVYYLNGTTNWSQTFGGLPTALWNPQVQVPPAAMALQPFGFTITGAANMPVVVEASTNLVDGSWTVIESAVLTNGSFNFLDAQSTNYSGRYYRIRSP